MMSLVLPIVNCSPIILFVGHAIRPIVVQAV